MMTRFLKSKEAKESYMLRPRFSIVVEGQLIFFYRQYVVFNGTWQVFQGKNGSESVANNDMSTGLRVRLLEPNP